MVLPPNHPCKPSTSTISTPKSSIFIGLFHCNHLVGGSWWSGADLRHKKPAVDQVSNQDLAKVAAEHQYLGKTVRPAKRSYHHPVGLVSCLVAETFIKILCVLQGSNVNSNDCKFGVGRTKHAFPKEVLFAFLSCEFLWEGQDKSSCAGSKCRDPQKWFHSPFKVPATSIKISMKFAITIITIKK